MEAISSKQICELHGLRQGRRPLRAAQYENNSLKVTDRKIPNMYGIIVDVLQRK